METKQTIKKIDAEKKKAIKIIQAENILKLAKLRAETDAINIDLEANAHRDK